MTTRPITQELLRELFTYDPATGVFNWRAARGNKAAGDIAGTPTHLGYIAISVERRRLYAHRMAWLFVTGEWPEHQLDHINGYRADNAWTNLRPATATENARNRKIRSDNTTGKTGVVRTRSGKFEARICIAGKQRRLGTYATADEANSAARTAREATFGAFARRA